MKLCKVNLQVYPEAREISRLALPLVITQLAQVAIMLTDTLMMGLLGTDALAAGGLAVAIFALFRTLGNGMISAISNIIAYERGKNSSSESIAGIVRSGFLLAVLLSIIFFFIAWQIKPFLIWSKQDSRIIPVTLEYLRIASVGMLPCLGFLVLRNFSVGLLRPGKLLVFTLIAIVLNVVFNYILMFGYWGFPALGLMGIAWASNIVFLGSFILFAITITKDSVYAPYRIFSRLLFYRFADLMHVLRLGLPLAVTYLAEAGFFTVIALLMGRISAAALAANTIANQCVYITFMISVGISHATSMCIGHAYGAGNYLLVRRYAYTALLIGFCCMAVTGLIFWFFNEDIMRLFIHGATVIDQQVYLLGAQLLLVAGVFQLFDGWQNIAVGILRGLKAMQKSMYITLFGYWVIGLSCAYFLGFYTPLAAIGIWCGLAIGLAVTAMMILLAVRWVVPL